MDFMRESQWQTGRSLRSILESHNVILSQQQRQQACFQRQFTLMEATQGSVLGNLRQPRESDVALSARIERLELSQSGRHRSRSRRPRRSEHGGEGTGGHQ